MTAVYFYRKNPTDTFAMVTKDEFQHTGVSFTVDPATLADLCTFVDTHQSKHLKYWKLQKNEFVRGITCNGYGVTIHLDTIEE